MSASRDRQLYGALDLGGTKLRAIVADLQGKVYGEDIRPSETDRGPDAVFDRMTETLAAAGAAAGGGGGPPGGGAGARPRAWPRRFGLPVSLANDASAAALGEHRFGAGRGSRHMLFLTVSTGLGGGIIIDGELYRGKSGAAGERGHMIIDIDGPPCGCGAGGCLEALASGTAIARRGERLAESGDSPVLARLRGQEGPGAGGVRKSAAHLGAAASREAFREAGHYLGVALAGYVNIFDPEAIIVGGGCAQAGDLLMDQAQVTMESLAMNQPLKGVRLVVGGPGGVSGAMGVG